jgi:hypothetical protein
MDAYPWRRERTRETRLPIHTPRDLRGLFNLSGQHSKVAVQRSCLSQESPSLTLLFIVAGSALQARGRIKGTRFFFLVRPFEGVSEGERG